MVWPALFAFQGRAVPPAQIGGGLIGGYEKGAQHGVGIGGRPDGLIRQQELAQPRVPARGRRHRRRLEPRRRGVGVGVEARVPTGIARPESRAGHLVGIGLARDRVGQMRHPARMQRRRAPREPRHRQIKGAPEQVDRAALAQKPGAETVQHPIALHQGAPVVASDIGVIRTMPSILRKGRRVGHLVRRLIDAAGHAQPCQRARDLGIEVRHGPRFERDPALAPVTDPDDQFAGDEVELHLETDIAMRNEARRQPPRRHPQRHMPAVVQPGRLRQPHLADDLSPQLQRLHRRPQRRGRQFGPCTRLVIRRHLDAPAVSLSSPMRQDRCIESSCQAPAQGAHRSFDLHAHGVALAYSCEPERG